MAAPRLRSEAFTSVDAAWLHMERPTNMAMITAVMMFDETIDLGRLQATIEHRFLRYERFRMRVKEPAVRVGLPRWETDPYFDLNSHLHRIALPAPGDARALQALVSDLMSTPLDFTKPLWQTHLVENCAGGCAVVMRLHHSLADGLALVKVLLDMTDQEPDAPWPAPPPERVEPEPSGWQPLGPILTPAVDAITNTVAGAQNLVGEGLDFLAHPGRALDVARAGAASLRALAKLGLSLPDTPTLYRGACGVGKRAVWSEPISLETVKTIARTMNATVNDVLMAALTGGLRRYLDERGELVRRRLNIRAMVPVSLRRPDEMDKLGNRFGLILLSLPIGIEDPLERLLVLKQRMDAIKASPEAVVAFTILETMGMTPVQIEGLIMDFFVAKSSCVLTNVPGPRQTLYYAGKPIRQMMFWVPACGHLGLGLSIYSYAGGVSVGVASDACLIPDPERIMAGFLDELAEMEQWVQPAAPAKPGAQSQPVGAVNGPVEPVAAPAKTAIAGVPPQPPAGRNGRGSPVGPPAAAVASLTPLPGRCQSLTAWGQPCKNRPLPGSTTCRVHSKHTHGAKA